MSSITTSSPVAARRQGEETGSREASRKASVSGFLKSLYNTYTSSHAGEPAPKHSLHGENAEENDGPILKRVRGSQNSQDIGGTAPILLYEPEEGDGRPPVLPLLPVQRLRLLRHKQRMRQQQQFKELQLLDAPTAAPVIPEDDGAANSTVVYHKSATPSPIKHMPPGSAARAVSPGPGSLPTVLKSLRGKRTAKDNQKRSLGTQWSAVFEYDAAAYGDDDKSEKLAPAAIEQDSAAALENVQPVLLKKLVGAGDGLTTAQRELLQNGPATPVIALPSATKEKKTIGLSSAAAASVKKNSTVLMPTVGFDFIKNSGTPTKTSPVSLSKSIGVKIDTGKKTPLFSLGGAAPAKSKDAPAALPKLSFNLPTGDAKPAAAAPQASKGFSFGDAKPATAAPQASKGFSFGDAIKKPTRNSDEDEEEDDLPRKKKRAQPDVSVDLTSGTDKPVFSFGGKTESAATKPAFSFGAKPQDEAATKPAFSFGAKPEKPALSFGAKPDKEEGAKPALSFGAKPAEAAASKPAFAFAAKPQENEKNEAPSKPALSFGAKPQEQENDKASSTPSFSFGVGAGTGAGSTAAPAKPAFSFGAPNADTAQQKPGLDKPVIPKLGELPTSSKENSTTPSFSFTPKPVSEPAAAAAPAASAAPKFSFASKPEGSTEPAKPAFSFGASAAASSKETSAPVANDTKPSFSFGQPPAPAAAAAPSKSAPSFNFGAQNSNPLAGSTNNAPTFGSNNAANPASVFGSGQTSQPTTATSAPPSGGFSFKRAPADLGSNGPSAPPSKPGFNFGSNNNNNANGNPQGGNNAGGFAFGGNTQQNNAPNAGFSNNANPNAMNGFGNNNQNNAGGSVFQSGGVGGGSSFNFGGQNQMGNGMAQQAPQMQQTSFHPSNTANFNFANNNSMNPAAIFNAAPPPQQQQQMFNGAPNNGMAGGNPVTSNFPGRKLARMRGQRR